jgi:4-hydroxyacetophenone monooxygenase
MSGNDELLADAVGVANIPTLVMVLVQLTGDEKWLAAPYTIARTKGMQDNDSGGLSEDLQQEIRDEALRALMAWRSGRPVAITNPSPELMVRMLSHSMGEQVPEEYGLVLVDELKEGLGRPQDAGEVSVPDGFRAVVVGAGISGIAAGIKLDSLGIPFEILEKGPDVGGVWQENIYPGAGVDTPSHLYSYSFAPHDWARYFASQSEILGYVGEVADRFGIREKVTFDTEVVTITWLHERCRWEIVSSDRFGHTDRREADLVLSCVGAFNPPVIPAIDGLETFEGDAFHTARWPADLELEGKHVVVVGNGASAMQVVPAIADKVAQLTILQRSPQWVQPFEKFMKPVPDPMRFLFNEVPLFRSWYRLRLSWIFHDKLYESLQKDPEWAGTNTAINSTNDFHRSYFTRYIDSEIGDRPELREKVVPLYPPFGKRMLQDNGWYKTLLRDNVELLTDGIAAVSAGEVMTSAGESVPADVIVLATGFDVVRFVSSFEVVGAKGSTLREVWDDDDCRAYLGLFVPGFPNFATVYGPNTQTGHGGSLIHTVEAQLHYLGDLLQRVFRAGGRVFDCKQSVYQEYGDEVQRIHERMIWTHPAMSTYYRNARGRVVAISPFRNVDYWSKTRACDLSDFVVTGQTAGDEESRRAPLFPAASPDPFEEKARTS